MVRKLARELTERAIIHIAFVIVKYLAGNEKLNDILWLDVIILSIEVKLTYDAMSTVLKRNTQVPIKI
jgi:molecular chaperone DnaK (HSP70)